MTNETTLNDTWAAVIGDLAATLENGLPSWQAKPEELAAVFAPAVAEAAPVVTLDQLAQRVAVQESQLSRAAALGRTLKWTRVTNGHYRVTLDGHKLEVVRRLDRGVWTVFVDDVNLTGRGTLKSAKRAAVNHTVRL